MSSLLRSPAIRRALSAASSGGPQGGSFLRAPSAAAPAAAGEGGATARRGLGLPTVPRRHLSGQEQNGKPPTLSPDQINVINQNLKKMQAAMDNGLVVCGTIRFLLEEGKLRSPFVQWAWMLGVTSLLGFFFRTSDESAKGGKSDHNLT